MLAPQWACSHQPRKLEAASARVILHRHGVKHGHCATTLLSLSMGSSLKKTAGRAGARQSGLAAACSCARPPQSKVRPQRPCTIVRAGPESAGCGCDLAVSAKRPMFFFEAAEVAQSLALCTIALHWDFFCKRLTACLFRRKATKNLFHVMGPCNMIES